MHSLLDQSMSTEDYKLLSTHTEIVSVSPQVSQMCVKITVTRDVINAEVQVYTGSYRKPRSKCRAEVQMRAVAGSDVSSPPGTSRCC